VVKTKTNRTYGFCPCFSDFGGEFICVNDDDVIEIDRLQMDPSLYGSEINPEKMEGFVVGDRRTCYLSIYTYDDCVYCVSQGWNLRIHDYDVTAEALTTAVELYSIGPQELGIDCSECIYGILLTLASPLAESLDPTERTASVKRYLDEFSLKIAVMLSERNSQKSKVADLEGIDYFALVREYIVELMEQQEKLKNIRLELLSDESNDWLVELIQMMENLSRYQFQFYSQVLEMRRLQNFKMLMRMLYFTLKSADSIYRLNDKIHSEVFSKRFKTLPKDNDAVRSFQEYSEESRTIAHFFGNILSIMKGLRV
jgi:hypothetical protein